MASRAVKITAVIGAVLEIFILTALIQNWGAEDAAEGDEAAAVESPRETWQIVLISLFSVLVPLVPPWVAARTSLDGFALGTVQLAVIIEAVLYVGWMGSPQQEAASYFWVGTGLPAVLVLVTVGFWYMQRKT